MVGRYSITFKIALHLACSSLFLVSLLAVVNTRFIQQQYIQIEQDKLSALMEDAMLTLGINLSYEFFDAVQETGDSLLKNDNILFVHIKSTDSVKEFSFENKHPVSRDQDFSNSMNIIGPGTGETIGTFTVVYSRSGYRQMMGQYYRYLSGVLILYLFFIFYLVRLLFKRLHPLTSLATQMESFSPEKKVEFLQFQQSNDEISRIAEAANVMLYNISKHADSLQQLHERLRESHDKLEIRVAERTEELQEKQLQLAHAGRLASLGEMAAGIAHELGQPLQIIKTAAEIVVCEIEEESLNPDEVLPIAKKITTQVDRSQKIINSMRTFARYDRSKSAIPLDVRIPLQECLSFFHEQFHQHQIILSVDLPSQLYMVRTDFQKFQQIIVNLLSNARYAVDAKFPKESVHKKNISITMEYLKNTQRLTLEISDNGIGMSKKERHRCLDPFYTTKDPGEGTGLGLAIAHGLIQEFNFQLDVISSPGQGSTFRVGMPVEQSEQRTTEKTGELK